MKTRYFTRDELAEMGVPYECGEFDGSAEELYCELYDTTRWSHVYELVFRPPYEKKAYRVYYECGSTEMQDCDLWNYENKIVAVEVEQVQVTKTVWKPVKGES